MLSDYNILVLLMDKATHFWEFTLPFFLPRGPGIHRITVTVGTAVTAHTEGEGPSSFQSSCYWLILRRAARIRCGQKGPHGQNPLTDLRWGSEETERENKSKHPRPTAPGLFFLNYCKGKCLRLGHIRKCVWLNMRRETLTWSSSSWLLLQGTVYILYTKKGFKRRLHKTTPKIWYVKVSCLLKVNCLFVFWLHCIFFIFFFLPKVLFQPC